MSGLLEWANSVRFTMANDSGRKIFQDQIQTYGFAFLDNYLDNILSGPSHDPLIELVKTPGRKKAGFKTKVFGSRQLQEMENYEDSKENHPPMNALRGAPLEKEDRNSLHPDQTFSSQQGQPIVHNLGEPLPALCLTFSGSGAISVTEKPAAGLLPGRAENDLSVIAEDDENIEPSSLNQQQPSVTIEPRSDGYLAQATRVDDQVLIPPACPPPAPVLVPQDSLLQADIEGSPSGLSQLNTVDSRPQGENANHQSSSIISTPNEVLSESAGKRSNIDVDGPQHLASKSLLPAAHNGNEQHTTGIASVGLAMAQNTTTVQDFSVPLRSFEDISSKSAQDSDISTLSSFPAPMHLRKSTRETSMGLSTLGAATPGAPPGGKRSSWLQKVREANALEVAGKHAPLINYPNPLKRKSDVKLVALELGNGERRSKSVKIDHSDNKLPVTAPEPPPQLLSPPMLSAAQHASTGQDGMLDLLKRTVEGLGAKVGKSFGMSPGTTTVVGTETAVNALAEARAAAEARVAERHHKEEEETILAPGHTQVVPPTNDIATSANPEVVFSQPADCRLSVSDLFPPDSGSFKMKHKSPVPLQLTAHTSESGADHCSLPHGGSTTTPPTSPPITRTKTVALVAAPVFNRPSPVFVPPAHLNQPLKDPAISHESANSFSVETETASKVPATSQSVQTIEPVGSLSKQSTLESMASEVIFDDMDVPAWMPNTQDTEYLSESQSQNPAEVVLDEDDSWPVDEKLAAGVQWTFGHTKEDSLTWSTLHSQSQGPDTASLRAYEDHAEHGNDPPISHVVPAVPCALDSDIDDHYRDDDRLGRDGRNFESGVACEITTTNIAEKTDKSEIQPSMPASQSSQPSTGFLSQASKLLNSALGANKKGKPEVKKVLQMAAVAAKKQQEENDKKAARLKEMENRRQLAIQRKADEEKARALEEERKRKDEGERRKREREENTEKRSLKLPTKKEEDNTKKRKIFTIEGEKKELKKPLLKALHNSSLKNPSSGASAAAASLNSTSIKVSAPKLPKSSSGIVAHKGKEVAKQPPAEDDQPQPSQIVQVQMSARIKARLQAANTPVPEPLIPSESIELPDINSEYSDSEDEDRPKSFPEWAQSPELREALQLQSTINPDDIFGAVRPLRMEELFKTRTSRFRARTSSANWTGTDRLTFEEEQEYVRRMGYK